MTDLDLNKIADAFINVAIQHKQHKWEQAIADVAGELEHKLHDLRPIIDALMVSESSLETASLMANAIGRVAYKKLRRALCDGLAKWYSDKLASMEAENTAAIEAGKKLLEQIKAADAEITDAQFTEYPAVDKSTPQLVTEQAFGHHGDSFVEVLESINKGDV